MYQITLPTYVVKYPFLTFIYLSSIFLPYSSSFIILNCSSPSSVSMPFWHYAKWRKECDAREHIRQEIVSSGLVKLGSVFLLPKLLDLYVLFRPFNPFLSYIHSLLPDLVYLFSHTFMFFINSNLTQTCPSYNLCTTGACDFSGNCITTQVYLT